MNIFPTPIHMCELQDIDNNALVDYAYSLRNSDTGNIISNKGGWQSKPIMFNNVSNLMTSIMIEIGNYASVLNLKTNLSINFTNQWLNINSKHNYNIPHCHSGFISGVYYAKGINKDHGKLILHYPSVLKSVSWNKEWFKDFNDVNCNTFEITPKTGLLVLFPSWLEHSVDQNLLDEDRISLSFNTDIKYDLS